MGNSSWRLDIDMTEALGAPPQFLIQIQIQILAWDYLRICNHRSKPKYGEPLCWIFPTDGAETWRYQQIESGMIGRIA